MTELALVVDVGTSSVRSSAVGPDGVVSATHQVAVAPSTPGPDLVEVDAAAIADAVLQTSRAVLAEIGAACAVGITNQRATTIVWDASTGRPIAPGIGWQDLRTVIDCLTLQAEGLRLAPNASATKLRWLVAHADPDLVARGDLRFGTVDAWVAWTLSEGSLHVTDATNAGVTGLVSADVSGWDADVLGVLGLDASLLPRIVDTIGAVGDATALRGAPPIAAIVGDQQASLAGQGCMRPGEGKLTFGTGAMLDLVVDGRPSFPRQGAAGCIPIVARRRAGVDTWGLEAVMLTAGACVEWLRDGLGLIASAADTDRLAASVPDAGGVAFVPALLGIGTPDWDFGARGGFYGLTRGSSAAHLTRAVLEGIAQRAEDLVEAAEADGDVELAALRVDGGMTANATFLRLLAEATGRRVEVAPELEATTRGAGLLALAGVGTLPDDDAIAGAWRPSAVLEPETSKDARASERERWLRAKAQALRAIPGLSDVAF